MAYPSIPARPDPLANWTALGDAWHAALTQALSDDPAIRADLTAVKGTVAGLVAGLAPTANPSFTGTVSGISKGMVGLGAVDNTADNAKALDGTQLVSGTLEPQRLPAGVAAMRFRTPANELNPSATNWQPRPTGYQFVAAVGAPPAPADQLGDDLHIPTTAPPPTGPQPITLTDGSTIPVWPGSEAFNRAQLIGAVTTSVTNQPTYDAYTSRLPASRLLDGFRGMAANVCSLLYASQAQVPKTYPTVTLEFTGTAGVLAQTWRTANPPRVEFGPGSIGASVTASYSTHEVVHLFQRYPTNVTTQTSGITEGIADWCLVQLGYHTVAGQRPSGGGTAWDAGYDTTAFFLDYVEKTAGGGTPGFVRALNASMNTTTWSPSVITGMNTQGKTVDQLWSDYKAWLNPTPPGPTPTLPFTDRLSVSYTAAGQTSNYHAWASGLAAGAGLLIWLHGDGRYEHSNPNSGYVFGGTNGVRNVCKSRGYICVSALSPDTSGSITWWEGGANRADYLNALLNALVTGYACNPNKIIIAGFSGGAQQTTQYYMPEYAGGSTWGGGTIVFGGGGAPVVSVASIPAAVKARIWMHWATGALDTAANSSEGYDALGYAKAGANWYEAQGFSVSRQWMAGVTHEMDGMFGGVVAAQIDAHGG